MSVAAAAKTEDESAVTLNVSVRGETVKCGGNEMALISERGGEKNKQKNKFVRTKMRPKEGTKIELQREICQILSDLLELQV